MKLTMNRIRQGEDEVIIRYREMNEQIEMLAVLAEGKGQKISAGYEGETILIRPEAILYLESVDGATWAYLADKVCRVYVSLEKAVLMWGERGFFRCSKSMVINIYRIDTLKSESGNRILAQMENGEQVMISRRYSRELRAILKGGAEDEEE
ncbi:MAG: LytTR family transcriptional regulator [Lachnospiraceae bacterium]|nr:LytTR family transcriptional regulator [Lachnospiraceae bacterium]